MNEWLQTTSPQNAIADNPQTAMALRAIRGKAWRRMQALLRQIEKHNGNISTACASLGMQRRTFYRWLYGELPIHRRFQKLLAQIKPVERRLDFAEAVIDHHLSEKNLIAAMFTLKSQGKHRGWSERPDVETQANTAAVQAELEQLRSLIESRAQAKGITFQEELKIYLSIFGESLPEQIGEKLRELA